MGYPELPPDNNGGLERSSSIGENFNPPTSEDETVPATDSPYSGYEQLTFDGENYTGHTLITENSEAEEETSDEEDGPPRPPQMVIHYPEDFTDIECATGNSFPDVIPVDIEVAQEVWNAPPSTSRANTIELDDTRTNQIINLMSNISLPPANIPNWAQDLKEETWKQQLLDKIRQGQ